MSYQLIKKVNYTTDKNTPVLISDYYLYKEGNERFLIFKFKNIQKDILNSFKFELTTYDKLSNEISKELYHITDLEIKSPQEFIYEAKIKVTNNFDDLSFDLVEAVYQTNTWLEGFWLKEITLEEEVILTPEIEKTPSRVKHFDIRKKRMPFIIPLLFSLIVVGLFLINANKVTKERILEKGLFEYNIVSDTEILITNYNGTDLNLVIPRTYDDYTVKGIADFSFQYNYFESLTFEGSNIYIGAYAFYNSYRLNKVEAHSFDIINNYAFANSSRLKRVLAIRTNVVSEYALYKTKRLKPLLMSYGGPFQYELRNLTPTERAELPENQ